MYKIGIGYDSHEFEKNKPFILGGVNFEKNYGLKGHSDGDALIHSIIDAILGASNLGDIGKHFPDTDEKYKNISSLTLLKKINNKIKKDYEIINIDNVIITEKPKLAPYIKRMKKKISAVLNIESNRISIKAKSNEKMGFIGRGEGLAVISNILLRRMNENSNL